MSQAERKDGYYVFNCNVAAKEMTSDIKAQVIDPESGRQGTEYTYSVKEYADSLLSQTEGNWKYTKVAPLIKATLNYGAAAQVYFDKTSTGLANAALSAEEQTLGKITNQLDAWAETDSNISGTTFDGATLSLKLQTTLSLYFTDADELTFSCVDNNGTERTVETVRSEDTQIARIRNIAAAELQYNYTLTVKKGEAELGSITYSPMHYCYKVLNNGTTDTRLQNTAKALYWYSKEAHDYFYEHIVDLGGLSGNYEAQNCDVLTGRLAGNKKITVAAGATVTLRNADITCLDNDWRVSFAGITLLGDANVNIEGTNAVRGGYEAYPGIFVPQNYTLTINGDGSLDVSSNGSCGIGGKFNTDESADSGNVVIKGGTINAVGSDYCAAIGSACLSKCGTITISGGTVTAKGGTNGAGIGSGGKDETSARCGDITITKDVILVTAIKGENAQAIGNGYDGICGTVTIEEGANVTRDD